MKRIIALHKQVPQFDIKISVGGDSSSPVAWLRKKMAVTFDDNETSPNWMYAPFTDLAFWPRVINPAILGKQFFKKNLYQYNGYKEDFYLADYTPNPTFLDQLPFKNYVVVRPENIKASYVEGRQSIVPELLQALDAKGYNILFLPRYESDRDYAQGIKISTSLLKQSTGWTHATMPMLSSLELVPWRVKQHVLVFHQYPSLQEHIC